MSKIEVIRQGGSLPFQFDLDGASTDGWVCTITVKQKPADASSVTRVITATSNIWEGYLTSTETAALAVGDWWLTGTLVNSANLESQQIPIRFKVTTKWA